MSGQPFTGTTIEEHAEVIRRKLLLACDVRVREFAFFDYSVRPGYLRLTEKEGDEVRQFIISVSVDPVERKAEVD